MAKFLFCLPRYHTNAAPWMQILTDAGHEVAIDVILIGPTEDHRLVQPVKHTTGRLSRLMRRISTGFDPSRHDFPAMCPYWRHMQQVNPDLVIVRGITRRFCRMAAVYTVLQRRKLVIYDQEDVTPPLLSGTWIRRALLRVLGIPHFTSRLTNARQRAGLGSAPSIPFGCGLPEHEIEAFGVRTLRWPPRLLMVAKYREHKGHRSLLTALAEIKSDIPFTVSFCGEEASEADVCFRSELEMLAAQFGFAERVSFLRNIPHGKMAAVFTSHDLFILPSRGEPAAVSPIEAAWAGCAVLLSRDSGTRGYFPPGDRFDFDAHLPDDIARALREALAGPKALTYVRDRCRTRLQSVASRNEILRGFERFLH